MGYLGLLKDVINSSIPVNPPTASSSVAPSEMDFETVSDPFDDADDEAFAGAIPGVDTDVEDDDNASSIINVTQKPMPTIDDDDNTDRESLMSARDSIVPAVPLVSKSSWEPVPLQQPFEPGSCPVSVATRFMVWNSVDIVTQCNTEEEESIDVEFHDTATHHAIHINNTQGHTMADLSAEAVLLASEADGDMPSQLVCMHFGSWDSFNEWNTGMPKGEDIMCKGKSDNSWVVGVRKKWFSSRSASSSRAETLCGG